MSTLYTTSRVTLNHICHANKACDSWQMFVHGAVDVVLFLVVGCYSRQGTHELMEAPYLRGSVQDISHFAFAIDNKP
jgi:hypothetical protein